MNYVISNVLRMASADASLESAYCSFEFDHMKVLEFGQVAEMSGLVDIESVKLQLFGPELFCFMVVGSVFLCSKRMVLLA